MSYVHPHDRLGHPRQSQRDREAQSNLILDWVVGRLLREADEDWVRIDLKVAIIADRRDFVLVSLGSCGSKQIREVPPEIVRAFLDLRNIRFEDGIGSWFSMRIQVEPPDRYKAIYNYTVDPMWDPPALPDLYVADLQLYPRLKENTPRWLRAKMNPDVETPEIRPGNIFAISEYANSAIMQLKLALPHGWVHAQIHFSELGGYFEIGAVVRDVTGRTSPWSPPIEVVNRLSELRSASRSRPVTWYTAAIDISYVGEEDFRTFADEEPDWISGPPPEAYSEELRRAGGFDCGLPDWLTRELNNPLSESGR
ncbi:hypothetical protein [Nocardia sp. NPDC056100]|uniref:hypothetical protein n=1 Tax=Nocardia sp. NPDC056100 TaxID=3345712 RepID=UPI0035D7E6DD